MKKSIELNVTMGYSKGKKHILKNIGKTNAVISYTRMNNGLIVKNQQIKPGNTVTLYYQNGSFYTACQTQLETISLEDFPKNTTTTTTTQDFTSVDDKNYESEMLSYDSLTDYDYMEQREPKILVATLMWQRFQLFKKFVKHYQNLGLDVLSIGSEGEESRKLCEELGCIYIEHPNEPFGSKLNRRLDYFLEHDEYTHILLLGSDDFIDNIVLNKIYENIPNYDIISWSDIYYLNENTGEILYSEGYKNNPSRSGEPIAPGRCISKKVIRELRGQLWDQSINKSPDSHSWSRLKRFPRKIMFSCKEVGGILLDVKTNENKNSFIKISELNHVISTSPEEQERIYNIFEHLDSSYKKSSTSVIDESSKISRKCEIGEFVVIEENVIIGENTKIGPFSIIKKGSVIGDNCSFTAYCEIRENVKIGNNTKFGSRCTISANSQIGDNVTIKYGFVLTDTPNLKHGDVKVVGKVDDFTLIGANVTLMPGFSIGKNSIIGACSQVRDNVGDNEIWFGSPAKFHKKNL
jgi:UDP-2-acetamido-3-amino-2,3-dideoxy-glucuronate N-acetyltransferase